MTEPLETPYREYKAGENEMSFARITISATALALILGACAGRAPQPVALVQSTDSMMDCAAISIEAQSNNAKLQQLGVEQGNKVGQNVAAGVVGLFIWPVWFAMDFQGAADKEEIALNGRNQYLTAMAQQRRCGVPGAGPVAAATIPQPPYGVR